MVDSAPEASNKELYEAFFASFQATRADLETRLESLKVSKTDAQLQVVTQDVAKLRRSLVDNTALLPSYDKRQCELQMGQLETALDALRPAAAAKPKFAFKRKAGATKVTPSPTPSTPAPAEVKPNASTTFRTLSNRSSVRLTWADVPPSQSGQHDLTIADFEHCILDLLPRDGGEERLTALHIRDIRDSILLLPEVAGSVLLHNLERCILVVGCHQYRMHTSKDVRVFLSVSSNPVIEHCSAIGFGAYPASLVDKTSGDSTVFTSKHADVQDFSHIRATHSPNWHLLEKSALPEWGSLRRSIETESVQDALDAALSWTR
ncbi:TBCC-domain-containing protein [Peniophora sp. CONT]|nr:TBCC-domain-containing protein [Peniophora sp. CONT]